MKTVMTVTQLGVFFFENSQVSSEITGVDVKIIERLRVTLSSGYTINLKKNSGICSGNSKYIF